MRNARFFLAVLVACAWAQTPTSWTPELSMQVQKVAEVVPAPGGRLAAWTQTRAVMEPEKSENITQIFLYRGENTPPLQLTRGEKSATAPAFSADSHWIFFTSERSGKKNIYRIATDGGEAEALTDWKGAIGNYRLSPNGKWVAFAAAEQDQEDEKAKKEKRDFKVIDEKPNNHSLWIVSVEPDASNKRAPRKLASGAFHVGDFAWSRDSRYIAFEHRPTPDAEDSRRADLSEVEVEGGTVKTIANTEASESQPRYSPDGRYLAFVEQPRSIISGSRVVLLSRQNGSKRPLAATPDETPSLVDWAADSSRIYFLESKGTRHIVYALPIDGPPSVAYQPARGTVAIAARLDATGSWLGFVQEASDEPAEAFLMNVASGKPARLSKANTDLPKPPLGETKTIRWKSKDGHEIEGLLTLPVGYESGKRYPLILNIHGGPAGAFSETFIGASGPYPLATFAARGYAVLRCNIRGSTGYGTTFRSANVKDWGGADYQDLMTGVDHVIASGVADPDKLAVMGWSYGGYMTAWIVSQTNRFKAAAIGAGLTNLWSMWGTNDIPGVLDDYFGGSPWEQPELYMQRSGLYYVKNIATPTLFLHGEQDNRVPISQAYEYYHAMKRRGVTTKMVTYPRTQHGPQEPKFVLDIMRRHLDWVDTYVR
jgi:dipeptidyl aminopeptidase/acylaminoacyl peptidase